MQVRKWQMLMEICIHKYLQYEKKAEKVLLSQKIWCKDFSIQRNVETNSCVWQNAGCVYRKLHVKILSSTKLCWIQIKIVGTGQKQSHNNLIEKTWNIQIAKSGVPFSSITWWCWRLSAVLGLIFALFVFATGSPVNPKFLYCCDASNPNHCHHRWQLLSS